MGHSLDIARNSDPLTNSNLEGLNMASALV